MHPAAYLLVSAAVLALSSRLLGGSTRGAQSNEVVAFYVFPFIAGISRVLFWRGPYNYAEHLIMVRYIGGHSVLAFALLLLGIASVPQAAVDAYLIGCLAAIVLYFVWAYSCAFEKPRWISAGAGMVALVGGIGAWNVVMRALVRLLHV